METVVLDTATINPITHWKQDLYVLDEPIAVEAGDRVEGKIRITRNPVFRRHLRVAIDASFSGSTVRVMVAICTPRLR